MPARLDLVSGQGRSWQDTLGANNQKETEVRLRGLGYGWEWLDLQNLRVITRVWSAIRKLTNGRRIFNQLIAAYRGWKGLRNEGKNTIRYEDSSDIPDNGCRWFSN